MNVNFKNIVKYMGPNPVLLPRVVFCTQLYNFRTSPRASNTARRLPRAGRGSSAEAPRKLSLMFSFAFHPSDLQKHSIRKNAL